MMGPGHHIPHLKWVEWAILGGGISVDLSLSCLMPLLLSTSEGGSPPQLGSAEP